MFVLLTRPQAEAILTAEKLAEIGYECVLSPAVEIVPTGAPWAPGVVDAAIATSARAFRCLELAPEWPMPEARRLLPLFVVGARTAEAARARGFEGRLRTTLDVKALCAVLRDWFEPGTRVLYLAGRDRKADLETFCAEAEIALDVIETYAAEPATSLSREAVRLAAAGELGAVVHFSRRSAEIFLRLAGTAGLDPISLVHIAISEDAAVPLAALPKVLIASEPNEAGILEIFKAAAET